MPLLLPACCFDLQPSTAAATLELDLSFSVIGTLWSDDLELPYFTDHHLSGVGENGAEHTDQSICFWATQNQSSALDPGVVAVAFKTANTKPSVTSFGKSVPSAVGIALVSASGVPFL